MSSKKIVFAYGMAAEGVDLTCLREALLALAEVALPDFVLYTLHHPAVTPLLSVRADQVGFPKNLHIFGPADEEKETRARSRFADRVTWVKGGDWVQWLLQDRGSKPAIAAGFFMGGGPELRGIVAAFRQGCPDAPAYFVGSTGGEAERMLAEQKMISEKAELPAHARKLLAEDLVYDAVFRRLLPA